MSTVFADDTTVAFDPKRAEAFAGRMMEMLNLSTISLMTSIGHQTGLFDTLADLPPSNSNEIAQAASLDERYVREWLGAMVTGSIVEYDRESRTYWLPAEHAATLTRAAGVDNLASLTQYVAVLGGVEQKLIDCFRNGGGVPYSDYPRFHAVMAEESGRVFDATLVQRTLPLVPGLIAKLEEGIAVADVGTGSGHAVNVMAQAFPLSSFTGYDFSAEGIGTGRAEARRLGLANARFELRDVATIDAIEQYDLITAFDAIHDQIQPREVLKRIAAALKPGGVFLMADIAAATELADNVGNPIAPMLFSVSAMHCMTVSLSAHGEGLGAMWGKEKAIELLREAGFAYIEVTQIPGDIMNNYFICRK
ncbi:MAG TPA: class I SAM-dependent methyltransferase [Thermoanaerobaculia bacterium]